MGKKNEERLKRIKKTGCINYALDIVATSRSPIHKPTREMQGDNRPKRKSRQEEKNKLREYLKR